MNTGVVNCACGSGYRASAASRAHHPVVNKALCNKNFSQRLSFSIYSALIIINPHNRLNMRLIHYKYSLVYIISQRVEKVIENSVPDERFVHVGSVPCSRDHYHSVVGEQAELFA